MTGAGQGAAVRTPSSQAAFLLSQTRAGKMGAEVDRPNNAAVEISVEQAKLIAAWLVNLRERQIADISGTLESMGEYAKLEEAHAALLREVEGLKAALDKYGRHFGWCAAISSRNTAEGCSCGFDAALSPASGGV